MFCQTGAIYKPIKIHCVPTLLYKDGRKRHSHCTLYCHCLAQTVWHKPQISRFCGYVFSKRMFHFIVQEVLKYTKVLKIADLQAHNGSLCNLL